MLEVKKVTKYYGKKLGIQNISFQLAPGEALALLGENGSGKTTSFRLILGLLKPNQGEILLNHAPIKSLSKNIFGYLPEERSLYKDLTVYEHLKFLGKLHQMSNYDIDWRIDDCLQELKITQHKRRKIQELSKGNQQKVQLIAALLHEPKLLILDEPFTGLDVENVELFLKVFRRLKNNGVIILFSSHQLHYCEEITDHLIYLKAGLVKINAKLSDLKQQYPGRYLSYHNKEHLALQAADYLVLKESRNDCYQYFVKDRININELAKAILSHPATYELKLEQVKIAELISQ